MEKIQRMERGSLQSETRPSVRQPGQNRGPYYKHQIWEHGRNQTRRVSSKEVEALSQAIAGRKEFERLAQQFIEATVQLTRGEMTTGAKS